MTIKSTVNDLEGTIKSFNTWLNGIKDKNGLKKSLYDLYDIYAQNNPTPSNYKDIVIKNYFRDLNKALEEMKKELKYKE